MRAITRRDLLTAGSGDRHHISSAVVLVLPERREEVSGRLASLPGVEVHAREGSRIVITIEGPTSGMLGETLTTISVMDGILAADMFETVEAGHILLADRFYDGDARRAAMAERGAWANIRAMTNRVSNFPFSAWVYRQRNAVERFFNKFKHFRVVATRYDKRDDDFLASVQLASIRIWLRSYESVTRSAQAGGAGRVSTKPATPPVANAWRPMRIQDNSAATATNSDSVNIIAASVFAPVEIAPWFRQSWMARPRRG